MISRDGRPTGLGEAFAHYGRIFKTLHILQVLHDETYRRMIVSQKNLHESRHSLARKVRHGAHGLLRERYREGMEARSDSCSIAKLTCPVRATVRDGVAACPTTSGSSSRSI